MYVWWLGHTVAFPTILVVGTRFLTPVAWVAYQRGMIERGAACKGWDGEAVV